MRRRHQCLSAERYRGAPGYAELLEVIADYNHPEHDDRMGWYGDSLDPTIYERERVNQWLKDIWS